MNPKKLAIIFFLGIIIAAGAGSIFYTMFRLRNHQEFLSSDYKPEVEQIEKAKGQTITLTETEGGRRKWVLKMKEIKYSKDNSLAQLIEINGLVYGDNNAILFAFNAPEGQYHKEKNQILLHKGAKMISPEAKIKIQAKEMSWSSKGKQIQASGNIQMEKSGFASSKAQHAIIAMDFSKIQLSGGVTSTLGNP